MNRGGARKGAGRKAPDGTRVSICARVSPKTVRIIEENRKDESLGALIDKMAEYYAERPT